MAAGQGGGAQSVIEYAALSTQPEFKSAVELQREIWGFAEIELLPVRLFVVATKIGGQALGAFDGERMIAFCLAIPGLKAGGKGYLHSHMLGVLPEYNNRGVGRMLKLAQREEALQRGIDLIEWTFDPLELKNAYFNIEKLGAIVRRYQTNHYGMTTSRLQAGLPTDRCVAEWLLTRERESKPILARIPIRADIDRLKRTDPDDAQQIQQRVARLFQEYLGSGRAVTDFER